MTQDILFSNDICAAWEETVKRMDCDRLFILTDDNTHRHCWPVVCEHVLQGQGQQKEPTVITIPSGDSNKSLEQLTNVWKTLQESGATRHSLMVNIGGGMVTDLGGFAASTFKRGIRFVNIPTTLLAMVDASVGGKTGINFGGLKNEIGTFSNASHVIINTIFLRTLDMENILSGYAEMIKHALLSDKTTWASLLTFDVSAPDLDQLSQMVKASVAVKERIVSEDPTEKGLRKALNLGHTIGHAIESLFGGRLLHGHCVAYGLVAELYLSAIKTGFPTEYLRQTANFIRQHYSTPAITCNDYPTLLERMRHDKKNTTGSINFSLLADIGDIRINQTATDDEIQEALDFLREG